MRYRISTLLAIIAVFAIAVTVILAMREPPHHVQVVIDHLKNLPQPCTAAQFDEHISKCKDVVPSFGGESRQSWDILNPDPDFSRLHVKVGDTIYGIVSEYTEPDPLGETFVSKVSVTKTVVKSMFDTADAIWSRSVQ